MGKRKKRARKSGVVGELQSAYREPEDLRMARESDAAAPKGPQSETREKDDGDG